MFLEDLFDLQELHFVKKAFLERNSGNLRSPKSATYILKPKRFQFLYYPRQVLVLDSQIRSLNFYFKIIKLSLEKLEKGKSKNSEWSKSRRSGGNSSVERDFAAFDWLDVSEVFDEGSVAWVFGHHLKDNVSSRYYWWKLTIMWSYVSLLMVIGSTKTVWKIILPWCS